MEKFLTTELCLDNGHANSAINPIVYCLITRNFHRSVHKLLCGEHVCQQTKFTWRCNKKPDASSSDYDLGQEQHKRCYLQMNALRQENNAYVGPVLRSGAYATTQLSHVARSSRRILPAHTLSADMLQRHGHIDFTR